MSCPTEDYALIGDTRTGALVDRQGSIDWLCLPRFDSDACFASLLGTGEHGRWELAPGGEVRGISRRYRGDTQVLESDYHTVEGAVRLVDFMPPGGGECGHGSHRARPRRAGEDAEPLRRASPARERIL